MDRSPARPITGVARPADEITRMRRLRRGWRRTANWTHGHPDHCPGAAHREDLRGKAGPTTMRPG